MKFYDSIHTSPRMVLSLDTRQQVCLVHSLEVAIWEGIFIKIPSQIATSKKLFTATACRLPEATFVKSMSKLKE